MPGSRILVVEDDKQVSSMLTFCLAREGYRVIESFDGQTGLDLALREQPDLIVLDLDLPKLDGLTVCSELHGRRADHRTGCRRGRLPSQSPSCRGNLSPG